MSTPDARPSLDALFRAAADSARLGVWVYDADGRTIYLNQQMAAIIGYRIDEVVGRNAAEIMTELRGVDPAVIDRLHISRRRVGLAEDYDAEWERRDGTRVVTRVWARPIMVAGSYAGGIATVEDVTAARRTEDAHRRTEQLYRRIVETANEGIWVTDAEGIVTLVNPQMTAMVGVPAEEIVGRPLVEVIRRIVDEEQWRALEHLIARRRRGLVDRYEFSIRRPDGNVVHTWVSSCPLLDSSGGYEGSLTMVSDISARKAAEALLAHRATHDVLTGLPNRALFIDHTARALARAGRGGETLAMLFLDVDRLKYVNDTWGHATGDDLLASIAHRLERVIRPSDVLARLGGDELTLLLESVRDDAEVLERAERLLTAIREPLDFDGRAFAVSVSMGAVVHRGGDVTAEQLLERADAAMYRAKQRGGDRVELFDPSLYDELATRRELEEALRGALDHGELVVHYQPIVDLRTGAVVAAESLLRWDRPGTGVVVAGEFIEVAEQSGLITPVGRWAIRAACAQLVAWDRALGRPSLERLFVNVSARELEDDFPQFLRRCLEDSGLSPERLCLELTETQILNDPELAHSVLAALKQLGCWLAIDDFGTGYSSLARLTDYPIDVLKIDHHFVCDVGERRDNTAIVSASLALGRALGHTTVAEGIETEAERGFLTGAGCDLGQGYLIGRPQPADAMFTMLTAPATP